MQHEERQLATNGTEVRNYQQCQPAQPQTFLKHPQLTPEASTTCKPSRSRHFIASGGDDITAT